MNKFGKYIPSLIAFVGVVALGGYLIKKSNKNSKVINKAIDSLSDKTEVEVSNEIVKAAIDKAAKEAAEKAAAEAIASVRKDIDHKVGHAVDAIYKDVEDEVSERVAKAAKNDIDMDELKARIEKKATGMIVDKFLDNLDKYASPIVDYVMTYGKKGDNTAA